ncbi:hypothetical protein SAMN05444143_101531 [Flavobacterium succinicans]|uniref:Uncharacterized protein n=1 Tax=Flavobacterium succinicans TaxID=29536 RepID=A0A1I4RV56_9FLAO|nr:hypothetical protein SAMN05444143_101531 [Flavobacterium succinicans]
MICFLSNPLRYPTFAKIFYKINITLKRFDKYNFDQIHLFRF